MKITTRNLGFFITSFFLLSLGCSTKTQIQNDGEVKHYYSGAELIGFVAPELSNESLENNKEAYFQIWADVDSHGSVLDVGYIARDIDEEHYLDSDWRLGLVKAAKVAISQWTFTPMIIDGEPTGPIYDFDCYVSLHGGRTRWIIKDVCDFLIYDSEDPSTPELPFEM